MDKKLKIWLPDDWVNVSDQNPEGPLTMRLDDPDAAGAFQVSTAEYTGGREPRPSEADLTDLAIGFGRRHEWGRLTRSASGKCAMGAFGTAAFQRTSSKRSDLPEYCQVWFLSNGLDFVFTTFIAMQHPLERELVDAQRIAEGIDFR